MTCCAVVVCCELTLSASLCGAGARGPGSGPSCWPAGVSRQGDVGGRSGRLPACGGPCHPGLLRGAALVGHTHMSPVVLTATRACSATGMAARRTQPQQQGWRCSTCIHTRGHVPLACTWLLVTCRSALSALYTFVCQSAPGIMYRHPLSVLCPLSDIFCLSARESAYSTFGSVPPSCHVHHNELGQPSWWRLSVCP